MKSSLVVAAAAGLSAAVFSAALAGPGPDDDKLVIEGVEIVTEVETPKGHPLKTIYSGWRFRSDETQGLEADDFENPAMVAVEYALDLWETAAGTSNQSCADCHGDVASMKGLRANMPRWSETGFAPAVTRRRPSVTMAWASTVAVVVPSPATSFVLLATSLASWAPMFS